MQTDSITLRAHMPAHLIALLRSEQDYETASGFQAAAGIRDFVLMASSTFFQSLENASEPDPWRFGFAILHKTDDRVIGLCGFAGPPEHHCVEIGYSIAPAYQGRGLATEAVRALIAFATGNQVRKVCAHTLVETNASTRVLEKCGFTKIAETTDPEGRSVWRWERSCSSPCRGE